MYIKYFNKTYSIIEGTYPAYLTVFYLQVILIFIVIFYYLLNVYIDIKTGQFTTNTQKIHHAIYLPCVLGHVMCLLQKILLIVDSPAASSTIPHACVFIFLSCLAYLGNHINFLVNRNYYYQSNRTDGGGYSLAQRFQISENIRFSFFFNRLALSIAFFQISGPVCLLIDNLNISRSWKNLNTVVFDTICLVYAIVTPFVIYHHNPKYKHELERIISKVRRIKVKRTKNQIKPMDSMEESFNSLRLQDTFGNRITFDAREQTNAYFEELDKSWS
ncbi:CBN-SRE-13 protein [Caenorhabditis brenneri]|uniref:CBN-SRE-13 protein n=1 Tax=Caenorhabditis brenneri TaxID=135651 RepID=G0N6Z9_CAEBE|nr:CBN-SRE-13 protein [Caenorhabditis brenneri]